MIRLRELRKTFAPGTVSEVRALQGVSADVAEGQFVTLIGTNGSGKSTLLGAVAGSFLVDSGTIELAGEDVTREPAHARARLVSRVFQNPFSGTVAEMSLEENLHLASLRGAPRTLRLALTAPRRQAYRDAVARLGMGLEGRMDAPMGTLSGGQRQALTLLMAVLVEPKVLLLDEHTAALDPRSSDQVLRLTERFVSEGRLTTLMVTHSMDQALGLGDRTLMLHAGRVVEDLSGPSRARLGEADLLEEFARVRRAERLDAAAARWLKERYQPERAG